VTPAERRLPDGYARFGTHGGEVVALEELVPALRDAMTTGTLYEYAARHPRARAMSGRGAVYAVPLPGATQNVVIRRSHRGGLAARFTRDRFVLRTRAPHELAVALRLRAAGVATPEVVAYAIYRAGGPLRRSDVATREIAGARDLAAALHDATEATRPPILAATARLLADLASAGARHPDLNLKNVLLAPDGAALRAYVLDVDRITFAAPGVAVARANVARLVRSARKWREVRGARIDEADIAALASRMEIAEVTPR
jgi:hypothetical protein